MRVPVYLAGLQRIRAKGERAVSRGVAGVEVLAPLRFDPETEVADATAALRLALLEVHACHTSADREFHRAA